MIKLPGVDFGGAYLDIEVELKFDDWARVFALAVHFDSAAPWWVGDALIYGEARYGDKAFQAIADVTGWKVKTMQNCRWVASRVAKKLRNPNLSWSHHRAVSGLDDPREITRWLDLAEESEWPAVELARRLKVSGELEPPPDMNGARHDLVSPREALRELARVPGAEAVATAALVVLEEHPPEHRCPGCGFEW